MISATFLFLLYYCIHLLTITASVRITFKMSPFSEMTVKSSSIARLNEKVSKTIFPWFTIADVSFDNAEYLNETIDLSKQINSADQFVLEVWFLKGFVISKETSPFVLMPIKENSLQYIFLDNSILEFYDKKLKKIDYSCESFLASYFDLDIEDIKNNRVNKTQLFEQIESSTFSIRFYNLQITEGLVFTEPLCPLLFKNMALTYWAMNGFQNNRLVHRSLEFSDLKETFGNTSEIDLNCQISSLIFMYIYRGSLSSRNIDKNVFLNTFEIRIVGVLGKITDADTFGLRRLKNIIFQLSNTREFLHLSDNKWLSGLNDDFKYSPDIDMGGHLRQFFQYSFRSDILYIRLS